MNTPLRLRKAGLISNSTASALLANYSEDQPRAPNGEFGSGGGSSKTGATTASEHRKMATEHQYKAGRVLPASAARNAPAHAAAANLHLAAARMLDIKSKSPGSVISPFTGKDKAAAFSAKANAASVALTPSPPKGYGPADRAAWYDRNNQ